MYAAPRVALCSRANIPDLPAFPQKRKRCMSTDTDEREKRAKIHTSSCAEDREVIASRPTDVQLVKPKRRNNTAFRHLLSMSMQPRRAFFNESLSTRPILATFVSSNKADVHRLYSEADGIEHGIPFACAFSADAKKGGVPILAIATQEGMVELLNVSKREDWDPDPQRTRINGHKNAILDIKWGLGDQTLATASGDSTTRITSASTQQCIAVLTQHTSSVKALDWDPSHSDILSTAGRDGSICVWDLRTAIKGNTCSDVSPVIVIPNAHNDVVPRGKVKSRSTSKTVTSLLYLPENPRQLVSGGSFDGILKQWDLRYPANGKVQKPHLSLGSGADPTVKSGSRSRGICNLVMGRNRSSGSIWGLAADSCIHPYPIPLLAPSSCFLGPCNKLSHPGLYVKSFHIKLAVSPCGTWLACGSSGGGVYLWDIASGRSEMANAVELKATGQEISAVDWTTDSLAACCDDGTVRMWRPNLDISTICRENPQEKGWDWAWASVGA